MLVKQISVFVQNERGRLSQITRLMAENGIDIRSISISDTVDFGILRCIVSDPDKAAQELKSHGFTASITNMVAVEIEDKPGGLARVLDLMAAEGIGVDYMYSFIRGHKGTGLMLFKFADNDRALKTLSDNGIPVLCQKDISELKIR